MSEPGGAFSWEIPLRIKVQDAGKPDSQGFYSNAITLLDAEFRDEMNVYFGKAGEEPDNERTFAERRPPNSVDLDINGSHLTGEAGKSYHVQLDGRLTMRQARQLRDSLSLALLWLERDSE
jgi:hypothetical protein